MKYTIAYGWRAHRYDQTSISSIIAIDEESYRSAGGAAAGAIIGGVLTGGIGLLLGAAIGGRRRNKNAYLVTFSDGQHVAFEETSGNILRVLDHLAQTQKVRALAREERPDGKPEQT